MCSVLQRERVLADRALRAQTCASELLTLFAGETAPRAVGFIVCYRLGQTRKTHRALLANARCDLARLLCAIIGIPRIKVSINLVSARRFGAPSAGRREAGASRLPLTRLMQLFS